MIFALDDKRMKQPDDQERRYADRKTRKIVFRQKFHSNKDSTRPQHCQIYPNFTETG